MEQLEEDQGTFIILFKNELHSILWKNRKNYWFKLKPRKISNFILTEFKIQRAQNASCSLTNSIWTLLAWLLGFESIFRKSAIAEKARAIIVFYSKKKNEKLETMKWNTTLSIHWPCLGLLQSKGKYLFWFFSPLPLCLRNTIEGSLCALHHTDPLFFLGFERHSSPKIVSSPICYSTFCRCRLWWHWFGIPPDVDTLGAYFGCVLKHPKTTEKKHDSILLRSLMWRLSSPISLKMAMLTPWF